MIGRITGRVDYRSADHALIDVHGVGYVVYCSERTLAALPPQGTVVSLYTELVVREDLLQLYGFATRLEKEWHRLLITVQGVGAKAAMAILGTLGAEALARAIALGDWGAVKAAPGIGPKIAQRVVNELKDKAPAVMAMATDEDGGAVSTRVVDAADGGATTKATSDVSHAPQTSGARVTAMDQAAALSALINLGYAQSEAASAVAQAAGDTPDATESVLIRAALRLLAPKD